MGAFTYIETDTGTNVDISAATAVGAYTSTGDKLIMIDVSIDAVAGNGDYVMYVTRQIGGSGSAYRLLPQTTLTAASGLTAISAQSGWITVRNGDVLTCYVDGLAGDTSTPDWTTRWFELAGVTAAAVADAVWDEAISGHTTGTTFGGKNQKVVPSETINDYKADVSGLATAAALTTVDNEVGVIDGIVDAIKAKTDNLPADPAAVGSAMTLTAAYDKAKDDVLTPLAVVDGIVDAIKAQTDKIPATPASSGEYTANIGAIKAKTDNLPLSPASSGEYTSALTAIQADLDNPNQYKADVSGLATTAHVQEVENKIDAIDVTTVASMGKIDALDVKVSAIDTDSVMNAVVDGAYTFEQVVQIMAAALAGKLSRTADTLTFRDLSDTLDRIVAETDVNKQRTDMTFTV